MSFGSVTVAEETAKTTAARRAFECRFAETPPTIDGVGDDAAWKSAQVIDGFGLPWLKNQARPSKTATKAKLLWDRDALYFFAELEDHDLFADITEHDGMTWYNDVFELFFKPALDKPGYYEFQVNAAGTTMDMFLPQRGIKDFEKSVRDGEFRFEARVKTDGTLNQRTDRDIGWTVEGRMPWTDFLRTGGRPAVEEVWKFTLCRYDYSKEFETPELSAVAPLQAANFHQHEDYADLKFVRSAGGENNAVPTAFHPLAPLPRLTTSRVVGSPEPPLPYQTVRRFPKLKLTLPIAVAHQPGSDRIMTITQDAPFSLTTIRRFVDADDVSESDVLLPSDDRVAYDLAFHPNFAENGFVYVGHNRPKALVEEEKTKAAAKNEDPSPPAPLPAEPGRGVKEADKKKSEKYSMVSRFKMNPRPPYEFDPKSEVTIIEWASDGHNGAAIAFGLDGLLYVTSGDGTSDSDTNLRGQDLSKLTAKVLRIDVDHPADGKLYSVPQDNPFVSHPNAVPETWAYGLRNPWRMTVDRQTGHIWVGNNGQDLWEQVYFVRKGDNYGWSLYEGSHPFYLGRELGPTPHVKPALEHHHNEARSLTGGIVYYGAQRPELKGCYIYGDHSTGKVWGAKHDGEKVTWHQELVDTPVHITGFGTDSRGELLICDHAGSGEGGFLSLVPTPPATPQSNIATFPKKLSETGLFRSVNGHVVEPALIPYSVNAPLWSDGTGKARFIAIPGENPQIDFTTNRAWGFPNGTVLVKSFSLEQTAGDAKSARWIETRLMTKQQNEWVGYSYQWNEPQTDATLVAKEGLDHDFEIATKEGSRKHTWHYPSRTECMVCHSRAVGFVLGLSTVQMNKAHDYGETANGTHHVENQLDVLERLGLFHDLDWATDARTRLKEELKQAGHDAATVNKHLADAKPLAGQRPSVKSSLLPTAPATYPHLVDPYDPSEKLDARARSYLHSNCSICHVDAGGGNAQMQLEFVTARDQMKLIDVVPVHDKFGLADARLVAPGHPERSVLLHRIALRGRGQMPQLATSRIDQPAVEMLTEWIKQMEPERRADAAPLPMLTPAQAGLNTEKLAEIEGLVTTAISEQKLPGCVILIGRPTGIAWLKVFGDKRLEPDRAAMTDDTVFDLASLTKPLATATSVLKLVEQGKVSLDDPVVKYIPEFGVEAKETITLRDLLVHRSGLIPDNAIADYADGPLKSKERLFALKLTAPIGSKFMYSDVNFMVLGEVVSRVSGRPLHEFAQAEVFAPLGMTETSYLPSEPLRQRAAPTEQRGGKWIQGEVHDPRADKLGGVAGHAGLFGTARDLARYATDAIAGINDDGSRVLKQATWQTMTTRHTVTGTDKQGQTTSDVRGIGWDMQSRYSINRGTKFSDKAFGHGGFTGTALWIDPDQKLYVIFLSNRVHPNGKGLVNPLIGKISEIAVDAVLP